MQAVQIVLFDGFDLLDAIAPYEAFCAAELFVEDKPWDVSFVTAEGPRPVASGTQGTKLKAAGTLDPARAGIIVVPGASGPLEGDGDDTVPSRLMSAMQSGLTGKMRAALQQPDVIVAAVCGGSVILALGGLLEGRPAVTNRLGMDLLGSTGAIPVPARVVDDGNLVTGGGVTSGLDVALYLVERELGPRIAHEVERLFEFERRGTVWRTAGTAPRMPRTGDAEAPRSADFAPAAPGIFDGEWQTTIATPIGKLQVHLSITTLDGAIRGTATQGDETVPFQNPEIRDGKLTWALSITKPLRLNLKFEVSANGDQLSGTAKAGVLPASKLTGVRTAR